MSVNGIAGLAAAMFLNCLAVSLIYWAFGKLDRPRKP